MNAKSLINEIALELNIDPTPHIITGSVFIRELECSLDSIISVYDCESISEGDIWDSITTFIVNISQLFMKIWNWVLDFIKSTSKQIQDLFTEDIKNNPTKTITTTLIIPDRDGFEVVTAERTVVETVALADKMNKFIADKIAFNISEDKRISDLIKAQSANLEIPLQEKAQVVRRIARKQYKDDVDYVLFYTDMIGEKHIKNISAIPSKELKVLLAGIPDDCNNVKNHYWKVMTKQIVKEGIFDDAIIANLPRITKTKTLEDSFRKIDNILFKTHISKTTSAFKKLLNSRMEYNKFISKSYADMVKLNYRSLGYTKRSAELIAQAVQKEDPEAIKDIRERLVKHQDLYLDKKRRTLNLTPLGGGYVFYGSYPGFMKDELRIDNIIQRSLQWDAIVMSHGSSWVHPKTKKKYWSCDAVYTKNGSMSQLVEDIVGRLMEEGFKTILLEICNPDGIELSDFMHSSKDHIIKYATSRVASLDFPAKNKYNNKFINLLKKDK
jgi:hypothetical protein